MIFPLSFLPTTCTKTKTARLTNAQSANPFDVFLASWASATCTMAHRPTRAFVSLSTRTSCRPFVPPRVSVRLNLCAMPGVVGACSARCGVAASGATAGATRTKGGLAPLRRATVAPLRVARVPGNRRVRVCARASASEFPAWDSLTNVAVTLHASVITRGDVFQIADAGAAEIELPSPDEIAGIQKGGWLGPITDALEAVLTVRVWGCFVWAISHHDTARGTARGANGGRATAGKAHDLMRPNDGSTNRALPSSFLPKRHARTLTPRRNLQFTIFARLPESLTKLPLRN